MVIFQCISASVRACGYFEKYLHSKFFQKVNTSYFSISCIRIYSNGTLNIPEYFNKCMGMKNTTKSILIELFGEIRIIRPFLLVVVGFAGFQGFLTIIASSGNKTKSKGYFQAGSGVF